MGLLENSGKLMSGEISIMESDQFLWRMGPVPEGVDYDMWLWAKDLVEAPVQVLTYAANSSSMIRQRDTFDTMTVSFPKKDYVINWDMTAGVQQGPYEKLYGIAFIGEKATIVTCL